MPAALCAPSTSSSGRRPSTSRRPGTRTAASPSSTTSGASGSPKNASTAARATAALSPWWAPCSGTQDVLVAPARGPQRDAAAHPPPPGWTRSRSPSRPPRPTPRRRRRPAARRSSTSSGAISPTTTRLPGSMIPALSRGDPLERRAEDVGVVEADVGEDRHVTVHHVGGVPRPAEAHLDDHGVDRLGGEPRQGRRGEQLEAGRTLGQQRLEQRQLGEDVGQGLVVDRLAVARQAFGHHVQVGAGVGADAEALGHQQRGRHGRGRPLAVGAGDVDGRDGVLGLTEQRRSGRACGRAWAGRGERGMFASKST